jgi:hypothetical protein
VKKGTHLPKLHIDGKSKKKMSLQEPTMSIYYGLPVYSWTKDIYFLYKFIIYDCFVCIL